MTEIFVTEKFDNQFHKRYVGGQGEVSEQGLISVGEKETPKKYAVTSYEEVLREYRKYIGDPKAELPEEIMKTLSDIQRTENDGKNKTVCSC